MAIGIAEVVGLRVLPEPGGAAVIAGLGGAGLAVAVAVHAAVPVDVVDVFGGAAADGLLDCAVEGVAHVV